MIKSLDGGNNCVVVIANKTLLFCPPPRRLGRGGCINCFRAGMKVRGPYRHPQPKIPG
jgi:hypothetical protein